MKDALEFDNTLSIVFKARELFEFDFKSLTEINQFLDIVTMTRIYSPEKSGSPVFDYNADFDCIYADFKTLGYDLIDEDLDWFKYNWLLAKIVNTEGSMCFNKMEIRMNSKDKENHRIVDALKY